MKETSGQFITEVKRRVKNNKELVWILVIVIFLALNFFLPKGITGFVSFSIYPEQETNESFGVQPIEEAKIVSNESSGFEILPVYEEIKVKENRTEFEILPENKTFVTSGFSLMVLYNQTDGFSTFALGSDDPTGITTNGSDFWIVDFNDAFVYHVNRTGSDQTDGFSTSAAGCYYPFGITTNNSDFWITDNTGGFVYHFNRTGSNMTDKFNMSAFESLPDPAGITTNNSDFWIVDSSDVFVYHVNRTGNNQTDGFKVPTGITDPRGLTTNNSDFWIVDTIDDFVYHTDRYGNNITDGFSTSAGIGSDSPFGIETNGSDFWITDRIDAFVYHIANVPPNNAPTIDKPSILPYPAVTNSTLNCSTRVYDLDLDTLSVNFSWYNGISLYKSFEITGLSNGSLASYILSEVGCPQAANETWNCTVTPNDGTVNGLSQSNITIISNSIPTINSIYIYSDDDTKNTTIVNLTGTFSVSDLDSNDLCGGGIDSMSLSYKIQIWDTMILNETKWYNNSVEETSLQNFTLILSGNTTKNDNWMFGARTYDGSNWSIWYNSSNFTILNTVPIVNLRSPANDTSSTTASTIFTYNVTDADGNEISNCTLWIESPSLGLVKAATNTSEITIDQDETLSYTLAYETINWSVGCTDNSNGQGNSTKWIYTVNQPTVEQPPGGGPSHGPQPPASPTPPQEQPPAPPIIPVAPPVSIQIPSQQLGSYWCGEQQGLSPDEIRVLINLFGYVPCWVRAEANITPKYKCNGIEFNINDIVGFGFNIYQNKPQYFLDIDFDPSKEKYCPWCYNKIQDYDETGIDCGGSCPPCIEKPYWICNKIPLVLILLIAMLLASLIYGYKKSKYKYEFRIGVSVSVVALISSMICRYLGVCYYKYLAFLYCLGIIFAVFLIIKEIKFLRKLSIARKLKIFKHKVKLPEIKTPEEKIIDVEGIVKNSIIEFNTLLKKIKLYLKKGKYEKAYHDYNALNAIYEYIIDKASSEQLTKLYEILERLYYELFTKDFKEKLYTKLKEKKLKKTPYKFKLEIPKIKYKKAKEEISTEEHQLDKVHKLLKENKLDEAAELYNKYSKFYLPRRQIELDLEKIKFKKLKKISKPKKVREELSEEEKKLNELHKLIKEYKVSSPKRISELEEIKVEKEKPKAVDKFDSEFSKLIDLVRKGKYKDAERKYKRLFK